MTRPAHSLSAALQQLVEFGVQLATGELDGTAGPPLFAVTSGADGEPHVHLSDAETAQLGERSLRRILLDQDQSDRSVLVRFGMLKGPHGEQTEAVLISAHERGSPRATVLAQHVTAAAVPGTFTRMGEVHQVGADNPLLAEENPTPPAQAATVSAPLAGHDDFMADIQRMRERIDAEPGLTEGRGRRRLFMPWRRH